MDKATKTAIDAYTAEVMRAVLVGGSPPVGRDNVLSVTRTLQLVVDGGGGMIDRATLRKVLARKATGELLSPQARANVKAFLTLANGLSKEVAESTKWNKRHFSTLMELVVGALRFNGDAKIDLSLMMMVMKGAGEFMRWEVHDPEGCYNAFRRGPGEYRFPNNYGARINYLFGPECRELVVIRYTPGTAEGKVMYKGTPAHDEDHPMYTYLDPGSGYFRGPSSAVLEMLGFVAHLPNVEE